MPAKLKDLIKEAAKYAVIVAPILVVLAAVLPGLHVSAAAVAVVSAAAGAVGGFVKWAKDHGFTPAAVVSSVAHRVR